MSDQQVPEGTEEATPEGTPTTPEVDWEKRYNDVRPEYDRVQNELNRYKDPAHREQLFNELASEYGYEIEQETQEYDDPADQLRAELAEMKQWRDNYVAEQQYQRAAQYAESYSEDRLDSLGVDNERQREWIVSRAMLLPAIQHEGQVVPDIEAAHREYRELLNDVQSSWVQSKEAPFTPQGGQENTGVPAWSDDPVERAAQRQAHWARLQQGQ